MLSPLSAKAEALRQGDGIGGESLDVVEDALRQQSQRRARPGGLRRGEGRLGDLPSDIRGVGAAHPGGGNGHHLKHPARVHRDGDVPGRTARGVGRLALRPQGTQSAGDVLVDLVQERAERLGRGGRLGVRVPGDLPQLPPSVWLGSGAGRKAGGGPLSDSPMRTAYNSRRLATAFPYAATTARPSSTGRTRVFQSLVTATDRRAPSRSSRTVTASVLSLPVVGPRASTLVWKRDRARSISSRRSPKRASRSSVIGVTPGGVDSAGTYHAPMACGPGARAFRPDRYGK